MKASQIWFKADSKQDFPPQFQAQCRAGNADPSGHSKAHYLDARGVTVPAGEEGKGTQHRYGGHKRCKSKIRHVVAQGGRLRPNQKRPVLGFLVVSEEEHFAVHASLE